MKKFVLFILTLSLFVSCFEDGECTDLSSDIVKVGLYSFADKKSLSIQIDSVNVENYDLLLLAKKKVNDLELPLHPEIQVITYRIYIAGKVSKLTLEYESKSLTLAP